MRSFIVAVACAVLVVACNDNGPHGSGAICQGADCKKPGTGGVGSAGEGNSEAGCSGDECGQGGASGDTGAAGASEGGAGGEGGATITGTTIPGLGAAVTVNYDAQDIPHISCQTMADCLAVQG